MDEEEEWEEGALKSEHLEVKPIRQNAQAEIHRGRKFKIQEVFFNIYTIHSSTSTTCFETTNYLHEIIIVILEPIQHVV